MLACRTLPLFPVAGRPLILWLAACSPGGSSMSPLTFLRRTVRILRARGKRALPAPSHRRQSATPRLEVLEDRSLLSTVTVNVLTDNNPTGGGQGGNGMGDLRWCILESLFRADTINFSV